MRMGKGLRKAMLALHITVSVGWIGAVAAYLVFDVTAATSDDAAALRSAYPAMQAIASWVIVPLAFASLASGLLMAMGTPWGLFRHWWVLVSLVLSVLAVAVLMAEMQTIATLAEAARDPAATDDDLRALPSTLVHSVGGLAVLVVIQVLNVVKPQGVTPYGWRKQQEERGKA